MDTLVASLDDLSQKSAAVRYLYLLLRSMQDRVPCEVTLRSSGPMPGVEGVPAAEMRDVSLSRIVQHVLTMVGKPLSGQRAFDGSADLMIDGRAFTLEARTQNAEEYCLLALSGNSVASSNPH